MRLFDFFDQQWQVRGVEAQAWRWHAVMFDIRRDMLLVRVSIGQLGQAIDEQFVAGDRGQWIVCIEHLRREPGLCLGHLARARPVVQAAAGILPRGPGAFHTVPPIRATPIAARSCLLEPSDRIRRTAGGTCAHGLFILSPPDIPPPNRSDSIVREGPVNASWSVVAQARSRLGRQSGAKRFADAVKPIEMGQQDVFSFSAFQRTWRIRR